MNAKLYDLERPKQFGVSVVKPCRSTLRQHIDVRPPEGASPDPLASAAPCLYPSLRSGTPQSSQSCSAGPRGRPWSLHTGPVPLLRVITARNFQPPAPQPILWACTYPQSYPLTVPAASRASHAPSTTRAPPLPRHIFRRHISLHNFSHDSTCCGPRAQINKHGSVQADRC